MKTFTDRLFPVALMLACLIGWGCGSSIGRWLGLLPEPPPTPSKTPIVEDTQTPAQRLQGEIDDLRGKLAAKESEQDEMRLAPIRTSILWAEGVSILLMLAGVGLAIATTVWGLGIGRKACIGIAAMGAGILATCLFATFALAHVGWIIAAVGLAAVGTGIWLFRSHLSLHDAAKQAWQHVPDDKFLTIKAEKLLSKIDP